MLDSEDFKGPEGNGTGGKVGIEDGNDGAAVDVDSDTDGVDGVEGGFELDTRLSDL